MKQKSTVKYASVPVRNEFLDKKECIRAAEQILAEKRIEGMTPRKLAEEIYSHAVVYDFCMRTGLLRMVRDHAHPIDLRDGGDRLPMRILFALMWKMRRSR